MTVSSEDVPRELAANLTGGQHRHRVKSSGRHRGSTETTQDKTEPRALATWSVGGGRLGSAWACVVEWSSGASMHRTGPLEVMEGSLDGSCPGPGSGSE